MSKFKTVCGVIAFVLFFLMLGAVGAIEQDIVPLFPGMIRVFALMALWVLFCNLSGAFDYTEPERRKPREVRREDPIARTGRTSRQSPCPSGRAKIIVEEVEKDRFVVTTTTETAHSKKN